MDRHSEFSKEDNIITDYVPSSNGFLTETTEVTAETQTPATVEVVGVKFKDSGKVYYFSPGGHQVHQGNPVIVETARGMEYGYAAFGNRTVPASEIVPPLRTVVRLATEEDTEKREKIAEKEREAYSVCFEKINEHGLGMKLIDAEYTFDESKLIFHFSADGRVDFRELVKDLASVFRTRIELRQIGIRDEAKLLGGLGVCGRPFCCTTFLSDFVQVSIKMAKEQNMSLNSTKISGTCGRLMCCLKYEHEAYEEEAKLTPPVESRVMTPDGPGTVKEVFLIAGKLKVLLDGTTDSLKEYRRDDVKVMADEKPEQQRVNNPEKKNPENVQKKSEGGKKRSRFHKHGKQNKTDDAVSGD
ncbi:MAG: stage 0 sporulation family protein [Clostridia bacterium]|nr:stage 0 sporulation family protein [Clostridia bacterium]